MLSLIGVQARCAFVEEFAMQACSPVAERLQSD